MLLAWRRLATLALFLASASGLAIAQEPGSVPLGEAIVVELGGDEADSDQCGSTASLIERVGHWLGRPTVDAAVAVRVELGRDDGPAASFELRRGDEPPAERVFDRLPGECAARIDALALAIAIAIDPAVMERVAEAAALDDGGTTTMVPDAAGETDAETDEEGEGTPEGTSDEEASGDELETEPAPAPWRFGVAAGGAFAWRVVPGLAALATLSFQATHRGRLVLRVGGLVSSRAEHELGPGAFASRLYGGRVDGCGRWAVGPAALGVCGGVLAGALRAQGVDFAENLATTRPWVAVAAGGRVAIPATSRLAVALMVEGVVPLLRPTVHVSDPTGEELSHESVSPFGILVGLEALVRFP